MAVELERKGSEQSDGAIGAGMLLVSVGNSGCCTLFLLFKLILHTCMLRLEVW